MAAPLIDGFQHFRENFFGKDKEFFAQLVERGQRPKIMIISCADSRVDPAILFNTRPGELFMVRNVANLIPPYAPDDGHHGVSAAIEFGVRDLEVEHIIVLGHAFCGGIQALCTHHRETHKNRTQITASCREFLNSWISIADPAIQDIDLENWEDSFQHDAERSSIKNSLSNLSGFPWVSEAVQTGRLNLHGWWFDMENGALWGLDEASGDFIKLSPNPSESKPF
jgi:carbonic anhydrase